MTLIEQLEKTHLEMRRERNNMATFVGTIIAESKRESKFPNDDQVIKILKKFETGLKQVNTINPTSTTQKELDFIGSFMPKFLSETEIKELLSTMNIPLEMKNMKLLLQEFSNRSLAVDASTLATVLRNV